MQHLEQPTDRELLYVALLTGLWWARLTYSLWRRTKYLEEGLRREQRKTIAQLNATQERLLQIFFREQRPTLQQLADDTESEFSLKP